MNTARSRQTAVEAVWRIPGRGTRLLVDLDAIERNVAAIAANVSNSTKVMAVVKASGYGHGSPLVAKSAIAGGASWLGVATVAEGIELRREGVSIPILVLGPTMPTEARAAQAQRLHITVGSVHQTEALCKLIGELDDGRPLGVHLKVNTGMNRYGVDPAEAVPAAKRIASSLNFSLDGVYTHFASADDPDPAPTELQAAVFAACLDAMQSANVKPVLVHAANSAALFRFRAHDFDMVRAGIGVYGVRPAPGVELFAGMRPAMRAEAVVQRLACVESGRKVGYGGTFAPDEKMRIGLLSLGYADGYPRSLSNRAWVGYQGAKLPVVGRVSMDQTTIGVPRGVTIEVGKVVTIIGDGSDGEPTVEELAVISDTIPYEILTGLGLRLPVFYLRSGRVVAYNDP